MSSLNQIIHGSAYAGYSYSYPHKSAYRPLDPAVPLAEAWQYEARDSLFLYLHVPFCEFRCGFCNLFTTVNAEQEWVERYLSQLAKEATAVSSVLNGADYSRVAIGGGTPTYLDERQLGELLGVVNSLTGHETCTVPASCESSPATLTHEKARMLREWGVDRLSLGVQTFDDREARSLGRPQSAADVERAIEMAREVEFPVLNLDLIYGSAEQSLESWKWTLDQTIQHSPEEVYLYPLYVRELTGLGRTGSEPRDDRLAHYRCGRDALLDAGYQQVSMRMFRLPQSGTSDAPVYCCQSDGMVGIGCGARSYTRQLHYSSEFAVGRTGVRSVLGDYLQREEKSFDYASYGCWLSKEEQKRRFVIQGVMQIEGLSLSAYENRFGTTALEDLPELLELVDAGLGVIEASRIRLTTAGIERSDAIGPWLYSPRVVELMEAFECV